MGKDKNMQTLKITEGTDLNKIIDQLNQTNKTFNPNHANLQFESWIYDAIPPPIMALIKEIDSSTKKDIALLTTLTIASALIKNYKVYYDGKMEGCQLYVYLLGDPAQGKGSAAKYRMLGAKFHAEQIKRYHEELIIYKKAYKEWEKNECEGEEPVKPVRCFLFLAGNSSKASLIKDLKANNGYGLIFETETDTLYSANKSDFGGFSDILRKGFHSENLSVNRISF
jgi:hypothetical protein